MLVVVQVVVVFVTSKSALVPLFCEAVFFSIKTLRKDAEKR
tara:strand:+ start:352 stop:474 length:123 start_codon:yes stop_codon:yes gene_type:complete